MDLKEFMDDMGLNVVSNIFREMETAEKLIEEVMAEYPLSAEEVNGSFMLLRPSEMLNGKRESLYEQHVKEILERVVEGKDTALATDAELLCIMNITSLSAPLNTPGRAVMQRLFNSVFPDNDIDINWTGEYPGQVSDDIKALRKKYKQEWRKR
jgi:hypothetical protein